MDQDPGPDVSVGTVLHRSFPGIDNSEYTAESSLFVTDPLTTNGDIDVPLGSKHLTSSEQIEPIPSKSNESASDYRSETSLPPIANDSVTAETRNSLYQSSGFPESYSSHSKRKPSPFESPDRTTESFLSSNSSETNFQDSSFINSTRAQFDLDINIDEHRMEKTKPKLSPWRNFKATSLLPLRQTSYLTNRSITQNSIGDASAHHKLDELSKQLTNCKIQLRLYERFLQDLIRKHHIDMGDVTVFHDNLDNEHTSTERTQDEISSANNGGEEMGVLVEDLYASLEEYQSKWREADHRASALKVEMSDAASKMAHLLRSLDLEISEEPEHEPFIYLDAAIKKLNLSAPFGASSDVQARLASLTREIADNERDATLAKTQLKQQVEEARKWKDAFDSATQKYELLRKEYESVNLNKIRSDEGHFAAINKNVDTRLQDYQRLIDRLQSEVQELRDLATKGSYSDLSDTAYSSTRDRDKFLLLQHDYETMQRVHDDLGSEFQRYRNTSDNTIASLTNQLNNRKRELINLRADLANFDNIQHDLEVAVEKQRILTSEKIKLSYKVESLVKDKASLHTTVENLTQKLASANVSTPTVDSLRRLANQAEHQLDGLLQVDVWEFERLLKSFNKIADDDSLREPKRKVEHLVAVTAKGQGFLLHSPDIALTLKEYHKSIFDYFARAVDVIVNDHIKLLLKQPEQTNPKYTEEYVEGLRKQISRLESRTDSLVASTQAPSPTYSLRIEELNKRWKAEREARIYENRQSKKRLGELEQELAQLKVSNK